MKQVAVAAIALMAAAIATPASALTTAHGTFGFVPFGTVTADTGDLTLATGTITYPDQVLVNTVPLDFLGQPNNLGVSIGDVVFLSAAAFQLAPGLGTMGTNFDITVNNLTFTFTEVETTARVATSADDSGGITAQFAGTLSGDANGLFELGTATTLSMSCDQAEAGSAINCSDTVAVTVGQVPEPASLFLLGAGLAGLGLLQRART